MPQLICNRVTATHAPMSARYVYAVVSILLLTVAYACWCRTALIWDGAYQLNASLISQVPYRYLTRFHSFFLWWPTIWASRFTSNPTLLATLFGLPFLLAPVVAVAGSWWMVKNDAPHLIIWPIFGVCAGSLPGQIFVINDSIFQLSLFWPILMSLFVTLSTPKRILLAGLIVFQFPHQIGVVLFLGAAVAAALVAFADPEQRTRLQIRSLMMLSLFALAACKFVLTNTRCPLGEMPGRFFASPHRDRIGMILALVGAAMFVLAVARSCRWWTTLIAAAFGVALLAALHVILHQHKAVVDMMLDTYAEQEMGLGQALNYWGSGVKGWPLVGLLFMWGSGLLALLPDARQRLIDILRYVFEYFGAQAILPGAWKKRGTGVGRYALILAAAGLGCWVYWAASGRLWWKALDYRRWVGPLTAPFLVFLTLEAFYTARERRASGGLARPESLSLRGPLALVLAGTFALVLGLQSTIWRNLTHRLMDEVMNYPEAVEGCIVPRGAFPWMDGTPLDHWGVKGYVTFVQGKKPTRLLLEPDDERAIYRDPPGIPHDDFYKNPPEPGPTGWFDLRDLLARLKGKNLKVHSGPHVYDEATKPR